MTRSRALPTSSVRGRPGRCCPRADGGLVRRTVLPGGLRVITEALPTVRSATHRHLGRRRLARRVDRAGRLLALPRAPAVQGHRHAGTRSTITAAIDAVGGEINAFTTKEYTCYYARVLDSDLPLAVDVLCDMVTSSLVDPTDVDSRARRDPRRDRDARGRPARRRARRVRRGVFGDASARPPDPRQRRVDQAAAAAAPSGRLLPAALPARRPRGRRRRQHRPRRRRPAGGQARVRAGCLGGDGATALAPASRPLRSTATGSLRARDPTDRAGEPGARHARRCPARTTGASPSACSTTRSAAA